MNEIQNKIEDACKAVIDALALEVTAFTGQGIESLILPRVVCSCPSVPEEIVKRSWTYKAQATITLISQADDTSKAVHRENWKTITNAFADSDAAATLTAATPDFHCYEVSFIGGAADLEGNETERTFQNSIELELICCAFSIS
jgi:hypothetical protein